jgi:hypothetical protein
MTSWNLSRDFVYELLTQDTRLTGVDDVKVTHA